MGPYRAATCPTGRMRCPLRSSPITRHCLHQAGSGRQRRERHWGGHPNHRVHRGLEKAEDGSTLIWPSSTSPG
eukprot:3995369-Pyramimonas_sp.AAC.1